MKLAVTAAITILGVGTWSQSFGYGGTANLTFSWANSGVEKSWVADTSTGGGDISPFNVLGVMTDATYFSQQAGNSGSNYYNSDFATVTECTTLVTGFGTLIATRKYGCRYSDYASNPLVINKPMADAGPGASASGTLTVTDTTLTGILTIVTTTDEPTGGTAASIGNGTDGYNLRQNDGSAFGNVWYGATTLGTYTVNLTGTFTATSWQITGGSARFNDAGFLCQQGGFSTPGNILCLAQNRPGAFTPAGGALSWGWELDGAGTGLGDAVGEIEVRDPSNNILETLSGVLASLSVNGSGNVTTNSGEIRRASTRFQNGPCQLGPFITYDPALQRVTCGELIAADLVITGTGPVPDADGDGVADSLDNCPVTANADQANGDSDLRGDLCDNCTLVPNTANGGVPNSPGLVRFQLDSDADGYGNHCDGDVNNSGGTTSTDYTILRSVIGRPYNFSTNAARSDLNASGTVTASDYTILRSLIGGPPGPSGLACAGTIPCPPP